MRTRIVLGIMFTVLLGVRTAFPQAAAESVLLNSHAAAATAKAGSVLGNALNKASGNIAGQLETVPKSTAVNGKIQQVQSPKTRAAGAGAAPVAASDTGSGKSGSGKSASGSSMITSVQGTRKN